MSDMPNPTPQTPTSSATPTPSDAQVLQAMGPAAAAQPTNLANEQAHASALSAPSAPAALPAIYNEVKDWKGARQWMANKYNKTLPGNAQINPSLNTPIPAGNDALVGQYLQSLGSANAGGAVPKVALTDLAMGKDPFSDQIALTGGKGAGTAPKAGADLISGLRDWWEGKGGKQGFGDRLGIGLQTAGAILGGVSPSSMPGIQQVLQQRQLGVQQKMPAISAEAYARIQAPAEAWRQNAINTLMAQLQTGKIIPAQLQADLAKINQTYQDMLRNSLATSTGQSQGGVQGAFASLANPEGEDVVK